MTKAEQVSAAQGLIYEQLLIEKDTLQKGYDEVRLVLQIVLPNSYTNSSCRLRLDTTYR